MEMTPNVKNLRQKTSPKTTFTSPLRCYKESIFDERVPCEYPLYQDYQVFS